MKLSNLLYLGDWRIYLKALISLVVCAAIVFSAGRVYSGDAGQLGQLYDFGVGVHTEGMGQAAVGMGDDVSTAYWNPAAMPFIGYSAISGSYQELWVDTYHGTLTGVWNLDDRFSLGFNYLRLGSEDFDGRDADGDPTSSFDMAEQALAVSGAYRPLENFSLGLTANYFDQGIDDPTPGRSDHRESDFGLDASLFYQPLDYWRLGVNVFNVVQPSFSSSVDEVPRLYRVGTSFWLWGDRIRLAGDVEFQDDRDERYFYGMEFLDARDWPFRRTLSVRAGMRDNNLTAGASLIAGDHLKFDYSIFDHDELDMVDQFSITYRWDVKYEPEEEPAEIFRGVRHTMPHLPEIAFDDVDPGFDPVTPELEERDIRPFPTPDLPFEPEFSDVDGETFTPDLAGVQAGQVGRGVGSENAGLDGAIFHWAEGAETADEAEMADETELLPELRQQAMINLNDGNYSRAAELINQALDIDPDDPQTLRLEEQLDNALAALGVREREAEEEYQQGLIEFTSGNYETAEQYFENTLELDSDHDRAEQALERVQQLMDY